ncbi:MAG: hypothetical protein AB1586_20940 [Pseudomonadota bacterium]
MDEPEGSDVTTGRRPKVGPIIWRGVKRLAPKGKGADAMTAPAPVLIFNDERLQPPSAITR